MAPLQRASSQSDQTIIQHFTHPKHPLQRVYIQAEYICDGCSTRGGAGFRYRCAAGCDFDLHEQCATCPHTLSSHIHPNHQLLLVNQPGNGHFCNSCGQLVNGLFYSCRPCDVDIHPICCAQTQQQAQPQPQPQVLRPTGPVLAARPTMNWAASQAPAQQVLRPIGPVIAAHPTMNWAASQAPASPCVYNNNNVSSPRFGVPQGFVQVGVGGGGGQAIGYPPNIQAYNNPPIINNNNGLVAAGGSNRQTNNNNLGKFMTKAVMTSLFGFPIGPS